MKTTNLGNIAVENFGTKRSKIPVNRNNFSSAGFGEVQVTQLLQVDPDTETSFSVENLTYVEPIVAPTYGHASVKYWHYFVAMRDLFNDFDAFLAKTNIRKAGGLYVVEKLPHVRRNLLSTLLLWGCKCTIYKYEVTAKGTHAFETLRPTSLLDFSEKWSSWSTEWIEFLRQRKPDWAGSNVTLFPTAISEFAFPSNPVNTLGMDTSWMDLRLLIDYQDDSDGRLQFESGEMKIPLANSNILSYFDTSALSDYSQYYGLPSAPVVIGKHDYLIEVPLLDSNGDPTTSGFAFAFKATAFAKRLSKVLKGAEFQEDFTATDIVSLMPMFGIYKSYYECFGILMYGNFENTNCKKLLVDYEQYCGSLNACDFSSGFYSNGVPSAYQNYGYVNNFTFQAFVKDMGSLWVTDAQDIVSAHQISPTISVAQDGSNGLDDAVSDVRDFIRNYIVGGRENSSAVNVPSPVAEGGAQQPSESGNMHSWIDRIKHSQTDCDLLKIQYLTINHETVAGKRVAQLLELAGFGDWMQHQKPRFIGYDEQDIQFSQVQSKADTLKDGTGMILGERGGVGESYKYHRQHTFTNSELGYIITLCAVVPDSGYVNTLSQAWQCVKKYDFYNAPYDGVGEELNKIASVVTGAQCNAIVDFTTKKCENVTDESFGYAPMMTRHKFVNNIFNGVFALNSVRDNFTPYSLDRDIRLGELAVSKIDDSDSGYRYITANVIFDPAETPRAGMVYRYPTRYPWLGRLARIFAAVGDRVDDGERIGIFDALMNGYEYLNQEEDGFMFLQTIRGLEWTHKLPITDSYETRMDGNKGDIDTNIGKA